MLQRKSEKSYNRIFCSRAHIVCAICNKYIKCWDIHVCLVRVRHFFFVLFYRYFFSHPKSKRRTYEYFKNTRTPNIFRHTIIFTEIEQPHVWYEGTSIKYIFDEYFFCWAIFSLDYAFSLTYIFTHTCSLVSCASNHQHAASIKTFNNSSLTMLRLIWNLRVSSFDCVSLPLSCFVFEWFFPLFFPFSCISSHCDFCFQCIV